MDFNRADVCVSTLDRNRNSEEPGRLPTTARYWRRVRYHACHETKTFFADSTSNKPVQAGAVMVYEAGMVALVTGLMNGDATHLTVVHAISVMAWGMAPLLALTVAVFLWEAAKAPSVIHRAQALVLRRARVAREHVTVNAASSSDTVVSEQLRLRHIVEDRDREITDLKVAVGRLTSQFTPRRLSEVEVEQITETAANGLRTHIENLPVSIARAATRIKMAVISVGDEGETINYRNDFVKAFEAAGFDVNGLVWPAGEREFESFAGCISLVKETYPSATHPNGILPIVAASLNAAHVPFTENDSVVWNPDDLFPGTQYAGALLVIGQRT
jgi:hypothetical protein